MQLLHPFLGFLLGYIGLVVVSIRTRNALLSLLVLILVYYLFSSPLESISGALGRLFSWNDLRVFVFIFLSMFLAGILREKGVLGELVEGTSSVGCRFSLLAVPALIGLLPMPGGALVSAIAMRDKYFREARLGPEEASFTNYWFRHIWVPSWPLFQSVVITATVFSIDPVAVVEHTWPATIAAIIGGLVVAYPILRRTGCGKRDRSRGLHSLLAGLWPFLLLGFLVVFTGLGLLYSLAATIAVVLAALRPGLREYREALRLATRPTIHGVLLEALLFKDILLESNGPAAVMGVLLGTGLPLLVLAFLLPFLLGLSAGGENFFAATAMPLLAPYIALGGNYDWSLLYISYAGGFLGVMMSPVHLCLLLTVDYYQASMSRVLGLVAIATLASSLLSYVFLLAL